MAFRSRSTRRCSFRKLGLGGPTHLIGVRMKHAMFLLLAVGICSVPLIAQQSTSSDAAAQNAALEQRIRELEDRVIALEGKIRTMQTEQAAQSQPSAPAQPAQPAQSGNATPGVPSQATNVPAPTTANKSQAGLANAGGQLPVYDGSSAAAKALNP